jgi:HAD domain in Swiss Army Knife RNA repair proteins
MFKVIFLDIDGVLNVIPQGRDQFGAIFHPHFVDNLRCIIEQTDAKIVISSTWRHSGLKVMQLMWEMRDLPGEVIDITPSLNTNRGEEIEYWLQENWTDRYCIIDDDDDMLPEQMPFFVKTSDNFDHEDKIDIGYGLTRKCSERAIEILNK